MKCRQILRCTAFYTNPSCEPAGLSDPGSASSVWASLSKCSIFFYQHPRSHVTAKTRNNYAAFLYFIPKNVCYLQKRGFFGRVVLIGIIVVSFSRLPFLVPSPVQPLFSIIVILSNHFREFLSWYFLLPLCLQWTVMRHRGHPCKLNSSNYSNEDGRNPNSET